MRKAKTAEELEKYRPKMGRRIVSDLQARQMAGKEVEPESFLNDPTIIDHSMVDSSYGPPPTKEEMMARHLQNVAERQREYESIGRTGKEGVLGDLPPLNFKMPARMDISSESEPGTAFQSESDKENAAADEPMETREKDEEEMQKEKEADETTPIAQQRTIGIAESIASKSAAAPVPSTPPARPDSGFKRPVLPARMASAAPRHSTPKMNAHHRLSFGADISIIAANNSMRGRTLSDRSTASTSNTNTRKESTGSRGAPTLESHDEEEEEEEGVEAVPANGTFEEDRMAAGAADGDPQVFVLEEREEEAVKVHVESVVMRRESVVRPAHVSMQEEQEVAVVGIAMRRLSDRPQDVSMMSIDEGDDSDGGRERREESQAMDDVEMASANPTPVRHQSIRPAKRPSMEHALNDTSSPMAVMMARRSSGLRETMVKPKVSVASRPSMVSTTTSRKMSTGSVASSIPFEDLSRSNLSVDSSDRSYEDAKTPERTPRTNRLLRQSLAAREQRQSQQPQRLPIVEESEMQGGGSEEEEEEMDEESMEMRTQRRVPTATPTTPVNRLPRLSQKLQSSVDRLSQPRHRQEGGARPCSRMTTPARVTLKPSTSVPSPSPARRRFQPSVNQARGMMITTGYTPNQGSDTTLMEDDDGGAKSGLATRIKRIPRRDQMNTRNATVLDVTEEQSDVEDVRRHQAARNDALARAAADNDNGGPSKDTSHISHATTTPITSPTAHNRHQSMDHHSFHEERWDEEEREEEEEEEMVEMGQDEEEEEESLEREQDEEQEEDGGDNGEEDDDAFEPNHSTASSVGGVSASSVGDDSVFVRPADPILPATPRSAIGSRRSIVSMGSRRSMLSDGDVNEDMDRLSRRASQISIDSARRAPAAAASFNGSFDQPRTPQTPFRALQARDRDLFSTDTPGIHSHRTNSLMSTTEEEEWAANQDSVIWRGDVSTDPLENEGDYQDDSQLSPVEEDVEEVQARILAPRKLIAPTASPGVRRSTRTRMKPVRTWLGEQAQYVQSPTTGERRLVGVNEVVIKDKLFVKTGTADIQKAVEADKKIKKQRAIASKKRKEQKGRGKGKHQSDEESE